MDVHSQTMDEMVFENRNKLYGAYSIRKSYNGNVLKALLITASIFIFGAYSPILAKNLGWIDEKIMPKEDSIKIIINETYDVKPKTEPKIKTKQSPIPKQKNAPKSNVNKIVEPSKKQDITNDDLFKKDISNTNNDNGTKGNLDGDEEKKGNTGTTIKPESEIIDFEKVNVKPLFNGDFNTYINENIDENLIPEDNDGEVSLVFLINENGNVITNSIEIVKSSGDKKMDKEAIRLTKEQPAYIPAKNNGKNVKVRCKITIKLGAKDE